MKRCSKCGLTKPASDFAPDKRRPSGCQAQCRECQRAYNALPATRALAVARSHTPARKASMAAYQRDQRRWLDALKDAPCTDCGGTFPPECMDFDHRDPSTKKFCIAKGPVSYGRERVLAEIEKCELVCANCHRVRTWKHRRTAA